MEKTETSSMVDEHGQETDEKRDANRQLTASSFWGGIGGGLIGLVQSGIKPLLVWDDRDFFLPDVIQKSWDGFTTEPPCVLKGEDPFKIVHESPDILVGSPACKRFSSLAVRNKDRHDFKMHDLEYFKFIKLVDHIQPKVFILENLPNIRNHLRAENGPAGIQWLDPEGSLLVSLRNYNMYSNIVNAKDVGIPQQRKRLFIVGFHNLFHDFEKAWTPTFLDFCTDKFKTVQEAFFEIDNLPNMDIPKHSQKRIDGFNALKAGQSYYETQNNRRLFWDKPSYAITSHRTQYVHPSKPRTLTVRECARLMSFPDNFVFHGPRTKQLDQVGCGICPSITKHIGLVIQDLIKNA